MKILIAVDGSEHSLDAVHHALSLVRAGLRASFVLAHVQEPASLYELVTTRDPDLIAAAARQAGMDLTAPARVLLDAAAVEYTTDIRMGAVANTLVDILEETACDLALVGARGLGGLRGALLGSVSQALVHESPVPVTIVKHAQEASS